MQRTEQNVEPHRPSKDDQFTWQVDVLEVLNQTDKSDGISIEWLLDYKRQQVGRMS